MKVLGDGIFCINIIMEKLKETTRAENFGCIDEVTWTLFAKRYTEQELSRIGKLINFDQNQQTSFLTETKETLREKGDERSSLPLPCRVDVINEKCRNLLISMKRTDTAFIAQTLIYRDGKSPLSVEMEAGEFTEWYISDRARIANKFKIEQCNPPVLHEHILHIEIYVPADEKFKDQFISDDAYYVWSLSCSAYFWSLFIIKLFGHNLQDLPSRAEQIDILENCFNQNVQNRLASLFSPPRDCSPEFCTPVNEVNDDDDDDQLTEETTTDLKLTSSLRPEANKCMKARLRSYWADPRQRFRIKTVTPLIEEQDIQEVIDRQTENFIGRAMTCSVRGYEKRNDFISDLQTHCRVIQNEHGDDVLGDELIEDQDLSLYFDLQLAKKSTLAKDKLRRDQHRFNRPLRKLIELGYVDSLNDTAVVYTSKVRAGETHDSEEEEEEEEADEDDGRSDSKTWMEKMMAQERSDRVVRDSQFYLASNCCKICRYRLRNLMDRFDTDESLWQIWSKSDVILPVLLVEIITQNRNDEAQYIVEFHHSIKSSSLLLLYHFSQERVVRRRLPKSFEVSLCCNMARMWSSKLITQV